MYNTDKQIMSNGRGTHAVQFILKKQFPDLKGLEECTFVLCEENVLMPESVQILHVNGNHCIRISTMDPGSDITIYWTLHCTKTQNHF